MYSPARRRTAAAFMAARVYSSNQANVTFVMLVVKRVIWTAKATDILEKVTRARAVLNK